MSQIAKCRKPQKIRTTSKEHIYNSVIISLWVRNFLTIDYPALTATEINPGWLFEKSLGIVNIFGQSIVSLD